MSSGTTRGRADRATAAAGAGAVLAATLAASITQRTPPTSNLISELGVPGRRLARTFRLGEAAAAVACLRLGLRAIVAGPAAPTRGGAADRPQAGSRHHRAPSSTPTRRARRLAGTVVAAAQGELRGLALAGAGGCLLLGAAVPSSPGCPVPLLDGRAPGRDWIHVPAATSAFYLFPLAATGRLRALLALNLALLAPPALLAPHGRATAVLQRTMMVLAVGALATWCPSSPATRGVHLERWGP